MYGFRTRIANPAASGKPIDSAVTISSQRFQSPIRVSSESTSSRTSGRPSGIPSVIGCTKYSYSPNRTMGDSARLARSRSRAISDPRDEIPCDPGGLLEDFRFSADPATSHQHDAVADHRIHDVSVGGIDPIADVVVAGRELRPARSDEGEVRGPVGAQPPRLDPQGPRAPQPPELGTPGGRKDPP